MTIYKGSIVKRVALVIASILTNNSTDIHDRSKWSQILLLNCISKQLLHLWSKGIVHNSYCNSWQANEIMYHLVSTRPRIAVTIPDNTFTSQMQQLLGNAMQEKDLGPPRSIMEVRSILCKDAPDHKDNTFYYWTYLHMLNSKTCCPCDLENPYKELNELSW